jgi:hypothetical protein
LDDAICFSVAKRLVFLHIPKTAGTSFTDFLQNLLTLGPRSSRSIEQSNPMKMGPKLTTGHYYFADLYRKGAPDYFMTFLRDPVGRVISQYKSLTKLSNYDQGWTHRWTSDEISAAVFCQKASFDEFVLSESPLVMRFFFNTQTRMLAGTKVSVSELLVNKALQKETLGSAKDNLLKRIGFLGIYEEMSLSLRILSAEIGINSHEANLRHLNQSDQYQVLI